MGAFHAYDIRGIYNVDFDKEVAYKVGYFLPELLSADKVLVGRDGRVSRTQVREACKKIPTHPCAYRRFRPLARYSSNCAAPRLWQ